MIVFNTFSGSNGQIYFFSDVRPLTQSEPASSGPDTLPAALRGHKFRLSKNGPETCGSRSLRHLRHEVTLLPGAADPGLR
jgi:hypothetical protein